MRGASRASQRFSRVLVLDKAIDALAELHEEDEEALASIFTDEDDAKTRLPPTDRGSNAMLFMVAAFVIEAVMWGEFAYIPIPFRFTFLLFNTPSSVSFPFTEFECTGLI